eukprot:m.25146 g.25146  ORF g.25146 m.25146 type:complete len:148 (+) comp4213_c0_seq2:67-510(+)
MYARIAGGEIDAQWCWPLCRTPGSRRVHALSSMLCRHDCNSRDKRMYMLTRHGDVNTTDCTSITIGTCTAMLFTYEGKNYTSILLADSENGDTTAATMYSDQYCGTATMKAELPNALTPNNGTFVTYYQLNDHSFQRRDWQLMCHSK